MKKVINQIIGTLLTIAGALSGLYAGGWLMFLKPIMNACQLYDAGTLTSSIIGVTILKCIFAGSVGTTIFVLGYYLGFYFYTKD